MQPTSTFTDMLSELLKSLAEQKDMMSSIQQIPSCSKINIPDMISYDMAELDSAKNAVLKKMQTRIHSLTTHLESNIENVQAEVSCIAEGIYKKNSSPHALMEKLYVSSL